MVSCSKRKLSPLVKEVANKDGAVSPKGPTIVALSLPLQISRDLGRGKEEAVGLGTPVPGGLELR